MMHSGSTPKRFVYGNNDLNDRIVPEEYKYNSSMINELIKQNKDLQKQLMDKQEEIDRLNVLIGSFRAKLIKYTELNKKLQRDQLQQLQSQTMFNPESERASSPHLRQPDEEYLQINKNNRQDDNKIDSIQEKLEALTKLVDQAIHRRQDDDRSNPIKTSSRMVSDDDIIISESQEFKQLQDQIDLLKRKLLIKKENELRKLSLNKELADLMEELNMNINVTSPSSRSEALQTNTQHQHSNQHQPMHCEHCHQNIHTHQHASEPRFVNLKESLETPTPTPTQTPRKLKREKDSHIANKEYSLW